VRPAEIADLLRGSKHDLEAALLAVERAHDLVHTCWAVLLAIRSQAVEGMAVTDPEETQAMFRHIRCQANVLLEEKTQ